MREIIWKESSVIVELWINSPHGWDFEDVPLDGSVKFRQIDADVDDVVAFVLVDVSKIDLWKETDYNN